MLGNKKRRRLLRMWESQDGLCYWCRRPCVLVFRKQNPSPKCWPESLQRYHDCEATVEHLRSRLRADRGKNRGEETWVMSCRKCNNERGRQEQEALGIDALHERAHYQHNGSAATGRKDLPRLQEASPRKSP